MLRLRIENRTDERVDPLIHLAAKVVSLPRQTITVKVRRSRRYWRGRSTFGSGGWLSMNLPPRDRFRVAEHSRYGVKEIFETYEEMVVGLAAHELAHKMRSGGARNRLAVRERFCASKWNEAVELYRSAEGRAFVDHFYDKAIARYKRRAEKKREVEAYRASDDGKLARLDATAKRWTTKLKRATNALKKLARTRKRLLAKIAKTNGATG